MKKLFVMFVAIIGFGINANAQCNFGGVSNISTSTRGNTVTITVTITPNATPTVDAKGYVDYEFVIVPSGAIAAILDSSRKSTTVRFANGRWETTGRTVEFTCDVSTYNQHGQCTMQDFRVESCYKK